MSSSSEITADLAGNTYVLIPDAQAIKRLDQYRDTLSITSFISTTEQAYIKKLDGNEQITAEKSEEDEEGVFDLAVSVKESVGEDKETEIIYFSSVGMLEDDVDNSVSGAIQVY